MNHDNERLRVYLTGFMSGWLTAGAAAAGADFDLATAEAEGLSMVRRAHQDPAARDLILESLNYAGAPGAHIRALSLLPEGNDQ